MQDRCIFNEYTQEAQERMHQDFVMRISKILLTNDFDTLKLNEQKKEQMAQMPINSSDPIYIGAQVFKDTLLEVNVEEDTA